MDSETTSLARANSASDEWRRYLAFVKRPRLPARASGFTGASFAATLRMLGLDLLMMLALILIAGLVLALGFSFPDNEINSLQWNAPTIALVVVVAPLLEELAFRSWLSGRAGHWLALLIIAVGFAVFSGLAGNAGASGSAMNLAFGAGAASLALAGLVLFLLRRGVAMGWFARLFPLFFWLATLGFASMHMLNYTEGALPVLLPLVLPQLITGTILGYVRVHYGLWSSVLLHALHNGTAVAAVVLSLKLGLA